MNPKGELCALIVEEHFGPIVKDVCIKIHSGSRVTLGDLVKSCNYTSKRIKECLFILIQHGIVFYYVDTKRVKPLTYYSVSAEEIISRQYYHSFCNQVESELGLDCKLVYMEVIRHGRISPKYLISTSQSNKCCLNTTSKCEALNSLISSGHIRPTTKKDCLILEDLYQEELEKEISENQKIPLTNQGLKKLRQKLSEARSANENKTEHGAIKRGVCEIDRFLPNKKIKSELNENENYSKFANDETMYRINYERALIFIRNELFVDITANHINKKGSEILKMIFELTSRFMHHAKDEAVSKYIQYRDLEAYSQRSNRSFSTMESRSLIPPLKEYISLMLEDESAMLRSDGNHSNPSYFIDLKNCATEAKAKFVESVVMHRFGVDSHRIWRLLYKMGFMSELQIANLALVPIKNTRQYLALMLYTGLVFIKSIPKSMDYSTSRTIFLWGVSLDETSDILAQNACDMICKIKECTKMQLLTRKRLIYKLNRIDVISGEAQLSEMDIKASKELNRILNELAESEKKVSEILMVLSRF